MMSSPAWTAPGWSLAAAARLFAAPRSATLSVLAGLLDEVVPGEPDRLVAMLTGDCSRAPLKLHGGSRLPAPPTSAELGHLTGLVAVGRPWVGTAALAGAERRVLAVASAPEGSAGALLAIALGDDAPLRSGVGDQVQGLWDVATIAFARRAADPEPGALVESLAAAQERARTIAELAGAHEATLSALLATLRARDVDDRAARGAATDLAVAALIGLRQAGDLDRDLSEELADRAFERLRDELRPLGRYGSVALELAGPESARRLPAEIAHAARAISRAVALVLLDQADLTRLRIAWSVADERLVITARDDGPGRLADEALAVHRTLDRVRALDGELRVDAVPGWGTTVAVALPLVPVEAPAPSPLIGLNPRELEVLRELTRGARNRQIAETLAITPHTVKFHVTNILRKLGVEARGEAAALAREHGLGAPARAADVASLRGRAG
jgi:DNA-binding CsgD family transcriptional regulator